MECLQMRIKDVDFQRRAVIVRQGKGGKDSVTMLPPPIVLPLRELIAQARMLCEEDRIFQRNGVMLSAALGRKYPAAGKQWG